MGCPQAADSAVSRSERARTPASETPGSGAGRPRCWSRSAWSLLNVSMSTVVFDWAASTEPWPSARSRCWWPRWSPPLRCRNLHRLGALSPGTRPSCLQRVPASPALPARLSRFRLGRQRSGDARHQKPNHRGYYSCRQSPLLSSNRFMCRTAWLLLEASLFPRVQAVAARGEGWPSDSGHHARQAADCHGVFPSSCM